MRYSLIVPLYNREDTIRACLDSLLAQTISDYEIIIVDDGSTDNSGKIADEYAQNHEKIKVIHKQNGGLADARNVGLINACGEYVLFPDSDDEYKSNLLEQVDKYYGKDLIVFGYDIEYLEVIEQKTITNENIDSEKSFLKEILIRIENSGAFNVAWNKAYKKEVIRELKFECLMPAEDLIFNCNYYKKVSSVAVLSDRLYRYMRKEDVSLATKYNPNLINIVKIANEKRKELYKFFGLEDTKSKELLAKKIVGYNFSLVPNIFRRGNGLKAKQKYMQLKQIVKDKKLKEQIKLAKRKDFNGKFFSFHVKLGNGLIAFINYSLLFFIRNNMTGIYKKLRRK